MKIFLPLVFVILFTGCVSMLHLMAETGSGTVTYKMAKEKKMDHPTLTNIIQSIDEISTILTVTIPPDFESTRKIIKTKNKGHTQMALIETINLVEKGSKPYLEGEAQNMEKAREMIHAVLRGSKKGFATYQREINLMQTTSSGE